MNLTAVLIHSGIPSGIPADYFDAVEVLSERLDCIEDLLSPEVLPLIEQVVSFSDATVESFIVECGIRMGYPPARCVEILHRCFR